LDLSERIALCAFHAVIEAQRSTAARTAAQNLHKIQQAKETLHVIANAVKQDGCVYSLDGNGALGAALSNVNKAHQNFQALGKRTRGRQPLSWQVEAAPLIDELRQCGYTVESAVRFFAVEACRIWEIVTWESVRQDAAIDTMPIGAFFCSLPEYLLNRLPALTRAELRVLWGGTVRPTLLFDPHQRESRIELISERVQKAYQKHRNKTPRSR
jgi:hypothetical protein